MGALQTLDYAVCELVISLHQPTAPDAAPDAAPQRILPPVLRLSACSVTPFSMPSAHEIKSLFRAYLRLGRNFPNYNIRHYITRRAKEEFHALAQSTDTAAAEAAWQNAQRQLDVWKRQSVVYGLYGRRVKTVMELQEAASHH